MKQVNYNRPLWGEPTPTFNPNLKGRVLYREMVAFFESLTGAESTRWWLYYSLTSLVAHCEKHPLDPERILNWRNMLAAKYKPRTVNKRLSHGSQFANWLASRGILSDNPFRFVRKIPVDHRVERSKMSAREYVVAKEGLKNKPLLQWMLICGYRTGLRLSDVCLLEWRHFDQERGTIRLVPWKTRSSPRMTDIPYIYEPTSAGFDFYEALSRRAAECRGSRYVCPELAECYMQHPNHPGVQFADALETLGIKRSMHTLRRAFNTILCDHSGLPLPALCAITGQSARTFSSYVKSDPDALRAGLAAAFTKSENLNPCLHPSPLLTASVARAPETNNPPLLLDQIPAPSSR